MRQNPANLSRTPPSQTVIYRRKNVRVYFFLLVISLVVSTEEQTPFPLLKQPRKQRH